MKTITTHEAKTHLSRYLANIEETGEGFIIARGKKPIARLVPLSPSDRQERPKVGQTIGKTFEVPAESIRALSDSELSEWGL